MAGITAVGEFFYLHHDAGGRRYADPNAMGLAVVAAAADAGIRITLLDTCYLQAGVDGAPLTGVQRTLRRRLVGGLGRARARRCPTVRCAGSARRSTASVRCQEPPSPRSRSTPAVGECPCMPTSPSNPPRTMRRWAPTAARRCSCSTRPEPSARPSTAVHATHLTDADIDVLGGSGTSISMCPTTERDLADGIGPAIRLAAAGSPLCVGSDGHAVIDLLEEGRAVELNERLATGRRGHLSARGHRRRAHRRRSGVDRLGHRTDRGRGACGPGRRRPRLGPHRGLAVRGPARPRGVRGDRRRRADGRRRRTGDRRPRCAPRRSTHRPGAGRGDRRDHQEGTVIDEITKQAG